ncbi:zinc finger CCHC domain-containing protein 7-like [Limanda limanda]|uniref:zinc finger CCHC domain-containing protein 7-like n=1 Tax=Limanda limanda TaxID=27771 RepID=UPI0029C82BA9|nr:zinc finger CCHC domain-containing protein 7-like [Limanda limanda]
MDHKETEEEEEDSEEALFVEIFSSSDEEGEGVMELSYRKRAARLSRDPSPPLLLALSFSSGRVPEDGSASPASGTGEEEEEEEEEDREQPVEEWMFLGGEEQVGDSSIHLNLSYWSDPEEESGAEDPNVMSDEDAWAISVKDKLGADHSRTGRYFYADRNPTCNICNRTGHVAKNCYYHKKCPTCVLCGIQGHSQGDCPRRPCHSCGLPKHGLRHCEKPPVWKQLCQRCGMRGHLSDFCPDTWRQYHLTIRSQAPLRPKKIQRLKYKRCFAHCYNCSKRGHHGFECTKNRMVSGTFPSLPYVFHYDTMEDLLQHCNRRHGTTKELGGAGSMQHPSEPTGQPGEENQPVLWRSVVKQETCGRAGRRKTWPERRRERQEIKKLRREAQARRQGGILGRSRHNFDDAADPFKSKCHHHRQSTPPPKRKKKDEAAVRKSRKSRETERWKKRGGMKRGEIYPSGDVDKGSENLLSPKQRVRHRRR